MIIMSAISPRVIFVCRCIPDDSADQARRELPSYGVSAPRIQAAFTRNESWIVEAGGIERGVPTAALSPFAPHNVITQPTVRVTRFSGSAVYAFTDRVRTDRPRKGWP